MDTALVLGIAWALTLLSVVTGLIYIILAIGYKSLKKLGIAVLAFYIALGAYLWPVKIILKDVSIHALIFDFIKGLFQ